MIQKLVDRLVNVDLLNRAADLLEHQVRFRLKGKEKARAGLKLAVIRLLDQNADGAAAALHGSRTTDLPPELEDDRRRVEAKAMRSEEHTSELQSLMRISYAVFCLK